MRSMWQILSKCWLKNINVIKEPPQVIPTLGSGTCLHLKKGKGMTAEDLESRV